MLCDTLIETGLPPLALSLIPVIRSEAYAFSGLMPWPKGHPGTLSKETALRPRQVVVPEKTPEFKQGDAGWPRKNM
jgi:hypothetical protein